MMTIAQRIAHNKATAKVEQKMKFDKLFWSEFFENIKGHIVEAAASAIHHDKFYVSENIADKITKHSEILLNQLSAPYTYNLYVTSDQAMTTAFRKFIDWIRDQQCTVVITVEIEPDTEELTSFIYVSAIEL